MEYRLNKRIKLHSIEHFQHKAGHVFWHADQLDSVVYSLLRVKDPLMARAFSTNSWERGDFC